MPYPTIEILVRLRPGRFTEQPIVESTEHAVEVLRNIFPKRTIRWAEYVYILCLDHSNKLMGYKRLAIGGRDSTVIDLDIIQCIASRLCAKKVILAHNHPGGSTRPSTADLLRTYELHSALKAQKKELVDHIIITADAHLSLKETGYFE